MSVPKGPDGCSMLFWDVGHCRLHGTDDEVDSAIADALDAASGALLWSVVDDGQVVMVRK